MKLSCVAWLQGKPKDISVDDDARTAALQWASESAFGNTEVAAPKILGDIVESLVGAVYLDTNHNFDQTWEVLPTYHLLTILSLQGQFRELEGRPV